MKDNEKLIEEALAAYWGSASAADAYGSVDGMRAAFAVFREARTESPVYAEVEPTDWGFTCADCGYCTEDPLTEKDAQEGARWHDAEHHPDSAAALRVARGVR